MKVKFKESIIIGFVILFGISELNTYNQIQKVKENQKCLIEYVDYVDSVVRDMRFGTGDYEAVDTSWVDTSYIDEVTIDTAEYNAYKKKLKANGNSE